MASEGAPWTLTIPSDLRLLSLARAFVSAFCDSAGLDEPTTNGIVLACDEATNNVMRHAHLDHPDAQVQLQCRMCHDHIEILIHDEGQPFDLATVPHLDPGELRVGGRGVFLMRAIMDELSCQPRGERGNTLRMVKRRAPRADSTA
jgi:serine/threonine-protein kinase RsbW